MREVTLTPTHSSRGIEENPPVYIYDTSGPYTDPKARIDLMAGLADIRTPWIEARGDTETLTGPSSAFGHRRQSDPALASLRFEHLRTPRRAKAGPTSPRCTMRAWGHHPGDGVRRHPREHAPG